MRTIKASEVVKGMRVRVERTRANVNTTIEGEVCQVYPSGTDVRYVFENGDTWILAPDHPVTVLAEPEPEWVEGAWYWTRYKGEGETERTLRHRMTGGWSVAGTQTETKPAWVDESDAITVLGRVLIVDWPGDDVARTLSKWPDETAPLRDLDKAVEKVADAIRTQGGVR